MDERVLRLEQAIVEAVKLASPALQEVVTDLQALRGIAQISAVTIAAELGKISRFAGARELMGYSGAVPSEDSSGKRTRRGSITKTGNAHLRRIVVEAAWSYRAPSCHRAAIAQTTGRGARKRSRRLPGRHNTDCTSDTRGWRRRARTDERSSPRWAANCWASSGPSVSKRKRLPPANGGMTKAKQSKSKNLPEKEKTKTTHR